jgi:integrase
LLKQEGIVMASGRITVTVVRGLEVGDEVRDSDLKGFGVRRQLGEPRYFIQKRIRGRMKRITIGVHGSPWTPETARREAARLLVAVQAGEDVAGRRDEARQKDPLFSDVAAEFLELHAAKLKPGTREEYGRIINGRINVVFGRKEIRMITGKDVSRAHLGWKTIPRAANIAIAVMSSVMGWAEDNGYRDIGTNPCLRVHRYPEGKRETHLTEKELGRLGEALTGAERDGINPLVIGLIRLLLLTGARLSELRTCQWSYVDVPRGMVRLPDSKTGAKTIILNPAALAVLQGLPRLAGSPWVFPGHVHGEHLVNVQKPWTAIRATAGLKDVRLHDLRHSFASFAVDVGGSLPIIGKLLGHTQSQTTERYAHVAPSPAQQVADAVGAKVAMILEGETKHPSPSRALHRVRRLVMRGRTR